jgi:heme-degrading monooxygenase HmoA
MFCSISTIHCPATRRAEYFALRAKEIEPAMRAAPGFLKRELFVSRTDPEKYVLIVYWESTDAAATYRKSAIHDVVRLKTIELIGARPATEDFHPAGNDGVRVSDPAAS